MSARTTEMDSLSERIVALRRYIALLLQEQRRLSWLKDSPVASAKERAEAYAGMQTAARKVTWAEKELRDADGGFVRTRYEAGR